MYYTRRSTENLSRMTGILCSLTDDFLQRFCGWIMLVYDSPHEHPRISEEEFQVLQNLTVSDTKSGVPWKSILTSGPVWVNCIAQWGGVWGLLTFMTQAPSYFSFVHGWNVNAVSRKILGGDGVFPPNTVVIS